MITFNAKRLWGNQYVVFTVPLPNRSPVFMSTRITDYNADRSGVVIVDAAKFLELWRNEPYSIHRAEANGNPQTWPNDRKYGDAVKGFSFGHENPVPLAEISHSISDRDGEKFHYVSFTNGITRTIWLLSNGCTAFPVECEMPGARELHKVAAAQNTPFFTVGDLAKATMPNST